MDSEFVLPSDQIASGRSFGELEIAYLTQALLSGTLTCSKGTMVRGLEQEFAGLMGARRALACASGTAAMHAAIVAVDPEPGDEVITSPITDMGAITPILYQGAIPVFCDVDPTSGNPTVETIAARISPRTRAIIVTHLFGNPCDMAPILALAAKNGLPVIEDCAQSFLASDLGKPAGTLGSIGIFSLQQGKHITCGEGGLIVCEDEALARRMFLFINKAWGYGDAAPDHSFLALNYRMSELQGAVARAQLPRLGEFVLRRRDNAERMTAALSDLPGVTTPVARTGSQHAFWRYALNVDPDRVVGGASGLAARLGAAGISAVPHYIRKPAFECELFQTQRTFGTSRWPFSQARPEALDYRREHFPGVYQALERLLVLPWNERMEAMHIDHIAAQVRAATVQLTSRAA